MMVYMMKRNVKYLKTYMPEQKPRTSLPFILHQADMMAARIEFEIELSDKSTKWVLGSMNQSKTTGEYILVVHDITQLRQLNSMRRDNGNNNNS